MTRRTLAYDSDLADGSLELVELAYASVPSYDAGWEQIHPEDQADWLASFKAVREHYAQLEAWEARGLLEASQRERFIRLQLQREVVEAILARLDSATRPPRPAQARTAALLSLVLDE